MNLDGTILKRPVVIFCFVIFNLLFSGCNNQFKEKVSDGSKSPQEYLDHKYSKYVPVGTSVTDAKNIMEEEGFACEMFLNSLKKKKMLICKKKDYFPGSPNNGFVTTVIYMVQDELVEEMLTHTKVSD